MTDEIEPLRTLDPIAFTLALVAAPVVVAVLGFWLAMIPIIALIGMPVYLIVGTPILLWMVTRYPMNGKVYALAGFLANCALTIGLAIGQQLFPNEDLSEYIGCALVGLIFAPVWSAVFAKLYRSWYRPLCFNPAL